MENIHKMIDIIFFNQLILLIKKYRKKKLRGSLHTNSKIAFMLICNLENSSVYFDKIFDNTSIISVFFILFSQIFSIRFYEGKTPHPMDI